MILCTSSLEPECFAQAAEFRARLYLVKPFHAQRVLQIVIEVLREARSRQTPESPAPAAAPR